MVEYKEPEIILSLFSSTPTSLPSIEQPWVTKTRKDLPQLKSSKNWTDLPGGPGNLDSICGQETRSHVLQLRPSAPKERNWRTLNWRMIILQRFSSRSESSELHVGFPSPGVPHQEYEPPQHLALKTRKA